MGNLTSQENESKKPSNHYAIPGKPPASNTAVNIPPQNISASVSKLESEYILIDVIGKGGFSKVYSAMSIKEHKKVAIKRINKEEFKSHETDHEITRESSIHIKLSHPNIVILFETVETEKNFYIIMEYVDGINMREYFECVVSNNAIIADRMAKSIFKQLIDAIYYLHSINIVHRDIKIENCMLSDIKQESCGLKLLDFGFATIDDESTLLSEYCGTPEFASPELLSATPYRGKPVDIWSSAVVIYCLCERQLPFRDVKSVKIGRNFRNLQYGPLFTELINNMLRVNPSDRYTAGQVLSSGWLS